MRIKELTRITPMAYKAVCFDGSQDIIPAKQVFGIDFDVEKSDAYWISAWILEKKNLQYSTKKVAWFDSETMKMLPKITIKKHIPEEKQSVDGNEIESLRRPD